MSLAFWERYSFGIRAKALRATINGWCTIVGPSEVKQGRGENKPKSTKLTLITYNLQLRFVKLL